jgi:hypothetical protein
METSFQRNHSSRYLDVHHPGGASLGLEVLSKSRTDQKSTAEEEDTHAALTA